MGYDVINLWTVYWRHPLRTSSMVCSKISMDEFPNGLACLRTQGSGAYKGSNFLWAKPQSVCTLEGPYMWKYIGIAIICTDTCYGACPMFLFPFGVQESREILDEWNLEKWYENTELIATLLLSSHKLQPGSASVTSWQLIVEDQHPKCGSTLTHTIRSTRSASNIHQSQHHILQSNSSFQMC